MAMNVIREVTVTLTFDHQNQSIQVDICAKARTRYCVTNNETERWTTWKHNRDKKIWRCGEV